MQRTDQAQIVIELKNGFESISPFIQKHTSIVCPVCEKVCCINKHSRYEKEDMEFISAAGIKIPGNDCHIKDADPCRFLADNGCSLERWMRPFRCTWFFCDSLLHSMEQDNRGKYREFILSFQRLITSRQKLTGLAGPQS